MNNDRPKEFTRFLNEKVTVTKMDGKKLVGKLIHVGATQINLRKPMSMDAWILQNNEIKEISNTVHIP